MTDGILSAAEIAEYVENIMDYPPGKGGTYYIKEIAKSHAALAAKLAEAERERDDTLLEDQVADLQRRHINQFNEIANLRAQLAAERSVHEGTLHRLTEVIVDLRREQATIAESGPELVSSRARIRELEDSFTKLMESASRVDANLRAELARERSLRFASEAREGELRTALERLLMDEEDYGQASAALAAPDSGAGDVLAAAEQFISVESRIDNLVLDEQRRFWQSVSNDTSLKKLKEAVRAYIARRGGANEG